jgi:hypothetical protein
MEISNGSENRKISTKRRLKEKEIKINISFIT